MWHDPLHTCRFCKGWKDQNMVQYGVRHHAHHKCYLDAGKKLSDLHAWQVGEFPHRLLKERGLLEEAERITEAEAERERVRIMSRVHEMHR